jgi:uncharacterized protein YndB with AHSA1/START domain
VWQAIADAEQFGTWFRVKFENEFAEGAITRGKITEPGYEGVKMEILIERIEPERYFSYRWHPYGIDPSVDYSAESTTLVEFTLDDTSSGTVLTIVESGFDRLPPARRAEAFRMNEGGWAEQCKRIDRYVSQP